MQHEHPEHADDRRRNRIGPDQERAVERRTAQRLVGQHGEQQRERQRGHRDREREREGPDNRGEIGRVLEQLEIVLEPDEAGGQAEGVLQQEGLDHRLRGRPVEKDQDDRELRGNQRVRQQL
ncbi:hypothetical protein NS44R_14515 [Mammaliicoccus sciuri]|nr:hypothetical protein NS44R_14515 [Mammaliicoccus sciuri]